MQDLISRQAAIDALDGNVTVTGRSNADAVLGYANLICDRIKRLPSADVQSVVRCKDCRHRYLDKKYGFRCDLDTGDPFDEGRSAENDDWFCADGIKMNGEQND